MTGEIRTLRSATPRAAGGDGHSGNGNDISARVAVLEVHMLHAATKNDVTELKLWMQSWALKVIGGSIVVGTAIAGIIVRVLF